MARQTKASVDWNNLLDAYSYVDSGSPGENEAFLNLETGESFYRSAFGGDLDELPEDIDDEFEKYLGVPDKRELNLGKRLVFQFVEEFLPDDLDRVERIFGRRGAYGRFKDMLEERNALEQWYDYENKATEKALRGWCEENDIEIVNPPNAEAGGTTESEGAGQPALIWRIVSPRSTPPAQGRKSAPATPFPMQIGSSSCERPRPIFPSSWRPSAPPDMKTWSANRIRRSIAPSWRTPVTPISLPASPRSASASPSCAIGRPPRRSR